MYRFIFIIALILSLCSCNFRAKYTHLDGLALGTTYHIVYQLPTSKRGTTADIPAIVEQAFRDIDFSLSIYNKESVISKVNRNEPAELDSLFIEVFNRGKEIYTLTGGAFDMAAAPYFDLWGFGLRRREQVSEAKLDSVREFAGMDKISVIEGKIVKTDPRVSLSANAIAKGYCADVIAYRLMAAGVVNLLVEVGGEIHCKGVNPKGQPWNIGIDRPVYGNFFPGMDMQATLLLSGRSIATSGNYRNFFEADGQKYGHTIDPATGRPVQHNLLSTTVIAHDCLTADAFATAFMVMGLEKTKLFLEAHPHMDAYLIYSDEKGAFQSFATPNVTFLK
ncbi:MAG: FAD:protein FMN transferase [Bacteroidales bacterium]|nr:FAD:protein FMN transferase [Bacteroidales bacterium]